ncbi:MAG: ABC transporter permease [Acidimicrobiales bacterium]
MTVTGAGRTPPPTRMLPRVGRSALLVVPLAFLSVFFVYPVASIVLLGLRPDGEWSLDVFAHVLTRRSVLEVVWFTLWQATVSTALTLLVGMPGAYMLARFDFPGRRLIRAAIVVPFVLPTVVVATAFLGLIGPRGVLGEVANLQNTVWAILIAHAFFNYAVVVRSVGGLWSHLDPRIEEAARVLGASRWRTFREVTLPLLRPAVASAAAIVFLFTFTSFGVVLVLGGPTRATLEVEVVRATRDLLDLPLASVLAVLQLAAVLSVLVVYGRLQGRAGFRQRLRAQTEVARPPRGGREWGLVGANLAVMAALLGAPVAVLVERSFRTAAGYGWGFYEALGTSRRGTILFVPPLEAVRNSVVFAVAATAIALVVGGMAATALAGRRGRRARWIDIVLMLPLGTSAVTVGFGFLIALDSPPLDLRASPLLIPIAHALVAMPFVVRILLPVLRSIDPRLREAAAVLGASPARVWREVDLPIVGRAALVAAGFAFAVSLGEFGATLLIARADLPTMPIAIFRFLGQPGALNFGQAMAMSTILAAVTATAVLLIERFRVGDFGEF